MKTSLYKFSRSATRFYFNADFSALKNISDPSASVIITDENVFAAHERKFRNWNFIVIKAGEQNKVQDTADAIIEQMIDMRIGRNGTVIGVGGGVITDLAGYVASVYMRGINFGFVPTSILAMVDAAIGGKNGIDVGVYKNLVGTINQPSFLLYDSSFLRTLPLNEWQNGFAEIIKHAVIKDAAMAKALEKNSISFYRRNRSALRQLIRRNAEIKISIVRKDEFEKGERRLLNFGHTIGHALENQYELSHGQAISIGMNYAGIISEKYAGFKETGRLTRLITRYGLPAYASFDIKKAMRVLSMDKKSKQEGVNYVLLQKFGKAVTKLLSVKEIEEIIPKV